MKDAQQADRLLGLGHAHTVDYGDSGRHPGSSCHPTASQSCQCKQATAPDDELIDVHMADAHDAMARQRTREFVRRVR